MTLEHTSLVARIDTAIKKNQSRQSFILLLQEISPALREQAREIERLTEAGKECGKRYGLDTTSLARQRNEAYAERDEARATIATQAAQIERLEAAHDKLIGDHSDCEQAYVAQTATIEALQKDADRWHTLTTKVRIHVVGWAGYADPLSNFKHLGIDLWSKSATPFIDPMGAVEKLTILVDAARS